MGEEIVYNWKYGIMTNLRSTAIILELLALSVVCVGIGIEIAIRAPIGYIIITSGSFLAALGAFVWAKIVKSH